MSKGVHRWRLKSESGGSDGSGGGLAVFIRERGLHSTVAQDWRWASSGPKAKAQEAKAVQGDKTRDAPRDLN